MSKTKKNVLIIVLLILIAIFLACAVYFVFYFINLEKIENMRNEYANSSVESQTEQTVEVPVDFRKLKKANKHIYAWISIPQANVDYPILRHPDNNGFYLNRSVNKQWSVYGSIFTENYNKKDFSDFNTLIYGHNMRNGSMFGSLKKFRDASFFKKNRYITIYMENRILKYEIFAACTWDNKHIIANRNFDLEENRTTYLEEIFAVRDMQSQVNRDIKVTAQDRIVTLSTCMNNDAKRFIVSGVLVYDSQNQ